jgi:hypothetical protein
MNQINTTPGNDTDSSGEDKCADSLADLDCDKDRGTLLNNPWFYVLAVLAFVIIVVVPIIVCTKVHTDGQAPSAQAINPHGPQQQQQQYVKKTQ